MVGSGPGERLDGAALPIAPDRRRGRGACSNGSAGSKANFASFRRRLGKPGRAGAFTTEVREEPRASSPPTTAPTSASISPSIPIAAASTAASTAYARPTHCYLGHSAGLDFETKLYAKVQRRRAAGARAGQPALSCRKYIALGAVTDPYQPIEREHRITRAVLEVLERGAPPGRHRHQVGAGHARRRHPRAHGEAAGSPRWRSR